MIAFHLKKSRLPHAGKQQCKSMHSCVLRTYQPRRYGSKIQCQQGRGHICHCLDSIQCCRPRNAIEKMRLPQQALALNTLKPTTTGRFPHLEMNHLQHFPHKAANNGPAEEGRYKEPGRDSQTKPQAAEIGCSYRLANYRVSVCVWVFSM